MIRGIHQYTFMLCVCVSYLHIWMKKKKTCFSSVPPKLSNYRSLLHTPSRGRTISVVYVGICNMYETSNRRRGVVVAVRCSKTSFFAYTSVSGVVGGVYFPRLYEYRRTCIRDWAIISCDHCQCLVGSCHYISVAPC